MLKLTIAEIWEHVNIAKKKLDKEKEHRQSTLWNCYPKSKHHSQLTGQLPGSTLTHSAYCTEVVCAHSFSEQWGIITNI